jgi:hypothetical protein
MKNNLPKFHPKHLNWLMPLILSGIMSGAISCFNMLLNKGLERCVYLAMVTCLGAVMAGGISTDSACIAAGT